jgi:hypothetical protein
MIKNSNYKEFDKLFEETKIERNEVLDEYLINDIAGIVNKHLYE